MWQPALLDIARTCYLAPKEPTYFAEWASLDLRVKRYDEGISAATHCIELAPEYADGYLLLGLLYKEKNMKAEAIKKADEVFGQIAAEFPNFEQSVTAQRAKLAFILDPEDKAGLAKPHYDKIIELINALDKKDDSDNRLLVEAYTYNMVYYLKTKDDVATSKEYAHKILAIDPSNAMATQVAGLK